MREGSEARKRVPAVAKRVDRAFPRNRRVTEEAKRRVAGGGDWEGDWEERFGTEDLDFGCPVLEQAS